jgi:hypothetical protein
MFAKLVAYPSQPESKALRPAERTSRYDRARMLDARKPVPQKRSRQSSHKQAIAAVVASAKMSPTSPRTSNATPSTWADDQKALGSTGDFQSTNAKGGSSDGAMKKL